ncbi:MAG: hypothetical protein K9H64_18190 [Bacteroidales bacterium]|nr:hypothetical protein [Bacteroidales bacterium]MCF8457966.1 hypothetical protein [Bacteroidales bacterium]
MKTQQRILILLVLNLVYAPALFAQEKTDLKETSNHHEISIGVADLFTKQEPVYYYSPYLYDIAMPYYPYYQYNPGYSPKLSLKYKYNFGKMAIRAGFDVSYMNSENDYDGNYLQNENSQFTGSYQIGLEFHSNYNRVQLFYGFDFFHSLMIVKNEYQSENYIYPYYQTDPILLENGMPVDNNLYYDPYYTSISKNENKIKNSEYGIRPLIGSYS